MLNTYTVRSSISTPPANSLVLIFFVFFFSAFLCFFLYLFNWVYSILLCLIKFFRVKPCWASFFTFCTVVLFFLSIFSAFCDFLFNFIIIQLTIFKFCTSSLKFQKNLWICVHWNISNKFRSQYSRNVNSKFFYSCCRALFIF